MSFSSNIIEWIWDQIKSIPTFFNSLFLKDTGKIGLSIQSELIHYYKDIHYGAWTLPIVVMGVGISLVGTFGVFMALKPIEDVE